MTFTESIKTCLVKKYCCFDGRASKSEYWWFCLFIALLSAVLESIPVLSAIFSIFIFLPHLGAEVRRLHDSGLSGWWVFSSFGVGVLGVVVLVLLAEMRNEMVGVIAIFFFAATLALNIYLLLRPSTHGANRFGSAPNLQRIPVASGRPKATMYSVPTDELRQAETYAPQPSLDTHDKNNFFTGQQRSRWRRPISLPPQRNATGTLKQEEQEYVLCPHCGNHCQKGNKFCPACAKSIRD